MSLKVITQHFHALIVVVLDEALYSYCVLIFDEKAVLEKEQVSSISFLCISLLYSKGFRRWIARRIQ